MQAFARISVARLIAIAGLLLGIANHAGAAELCPFMTQGSAAKLLGGDVSATVNSTEDRDGACTFTRQQASITYTLAIVVHKTPTDPCPEHSTPLKAVGNEAMSCRFSPSSSETTEKISGRVRDMFFTIALTIRGPKGPDMPVEAEREAVNQAAEQVTGNLY